MANFAELSNLLNQLKTTLNDSCFNSQINQAPNSRVLGATLSLMCFRSSQIYDSQIDSLLTTIVSILKSMVIYDSHSHLIGDSGEQLLRIGADLLGVLEGYYGLSSETKDRFHTLLHAVLRAAVSSSNCELFAPSEPILSEEDETVKAGRKTAIKKLTRFLSSETPDRSNEIPSRLLFWYLDPSTLKHDISEMLMETARRPFLCLKKELHARKSWSSIILCYVTSPTMFLETRVLLHSWFLLTGLDSVLNLQVALVASVLDFLSRPMYWGISMETGLKLPFSCAYFPRKYREFLSILSGPISCESFLDLVPHIRAAAIPPLKFSNQKDIHAVDNTSAWSLLIAFPAWFYFAIILLFHGEESQDSYLSKAICGSSETDTRKLNDLHEAAAFYLSWIVNPHNETNFNLLADHIHKSTKSWSTKTVLNSSKKKTHAHARKLRVPKINNYDIGLAIQSWIEEFNNSCVNLCSGKAKNKHDVQPNLLLLRISLGILITSSNLDEKGTGLVLHYATTGNILQTREIHENAWAVDGACLVFDLIDILDEISVMIFDSEDTRSSFILKMKGKVSGYLMLCVKALVKNLTDVFHIDEGRERNMEDLHRRLTLWTQKGHENFEGYSAISKIADDFAIRFKIATENAGA